MLKNCFDVSNSFHQYYENRFDNVVENHWWIFVKTNNDSSVVKNDNSTYVDNINNNIDFEIYATISNNRYKDQSKSVVNNSLFLKDFLKKSSFIFLEQSYYAYSFENRCLINTLLMTKSKKKNAIAIDDDTIKKRKRSLVSYDRISRVCKFKTILIYDVKQSKKRSNQQRELDWLT